MTDRLAGGDGAEAVGAGLVGELVGEGNIDPEEIVEGPFKLEVGQATSGDTARPLPLSLLHTAEPLAAGLDKALAGLRGEHVGLWRRHLTIVHAIDDPHPTREVGSARGGAAERGQIEACLGSLPLVAAQAVVRKEGGQSLGES